MATTSLVHRLTATERATALLADAANKDRFYENSSMYQEPRYALRKGDDAATAMYSAQAATAHALLAVVGELRGLRSDLQQQAAVAREDVAGIAAEVGELGAALEEPLKAISDSVDGLTDQVEAVRDEVEDGLAAVASTMAPLFERRWSRRWRTWRFWLSWPVRRRRLQDRPTRAQVGERLILGAAPATWLSDILTSAADLMQGEGWGLQPSGVMDAISHIASSPEAPDAAHVLCVKAREAIVAYLGEPLWRWEIASGRTQSEVVAMLREVAAKSAVSELAPDGARKGPGNAAAMAHSPAPVGARPTLVVPAIPAGQRALEQLAHLQEVLRDLAVTLPDNPNMSGLRQGLAIKVCDAWEATTWVLATVGEAHGGTGAQGPVRDAVLLLRAALEEMGPAGTPTIAAVQAVRDRLTELLKTVAAAAVARAEVDR